MPKKGRGTGGELDPPKLPTRLKTALEALYGHYKKTFELLLIDSEELESGEALDDKFRAMAADEIERFRRDIVERTGDARAAETITDQELLREVMNTIGKKDQLCAGIRCVVSVSISEAAPVRSVEADHKAVARHVPRLQGRNVPGTAAVRGSG